MKLLRNTGNERVIDRLRDWTARGAAIDLMSPGFSLYAFAEVRDMLAKPGRVRLLLGEQGALTHTLFGGPADTSYRSRLQGRWLAKAAHEWIRSHAEIRHAAAGPPQSLIVLNGEAAQRAVLGTCAFTTEGLGITPGSQLGLVQATDTDDEAAAFAHWFQSSWDALPAQAASNEPLASILAESASHRPPSLLYFKVLFELFKDLGSGLIDRARR